MGAGLQARCGSTREPRSGNPPPPPGSAVSFRPGAVGGGISPRGPDTRSSRPAWSRGGPVVGAPRGVPKPHSCPPLEVPALPGDAIRETTLLGVGATSVPSGPGAPPAASPAGKGKGLVAPAPGGRGRALIHRRTGAAGSTPAVGFPRLSVAAAETRCSLASSSLAEGRPRWGQEGEIHERLRLASSVGNGAAGGHSAPHRDAARPTLGAAASGSAAHAHGNRFTARDRAEGLPGPPGASHRRLGGRIGSLLTCENRSRGTSCLPEAAPDSRDSRVSRSSVAASGRR